MEKIYENNLMKTWTRKIKNFFYYKKLIIKTNITCL